MNRFLWSCATLLTLLVTAESLICNKCDVSILGSCIGSTSENCSAGLDQCYSGEARFSADLLPIYARGCIAKADCINQTNVPLLTISYSVTRHCCSSDLCNGAAAVQLPLATVLGAALVAVWSQWGL